MASAQMTSAGNTAKESKARGRSCAVAGRTPGPGFKELPNKYKPHHTEMSHHWCFYCTPISNFICNPMKNTVGFITCILLLVSCLFIFIMCEFMKRAVFVTVVALSSHKGVLNVQSIREIQWGRALHAGNATRQASTDADATTIYYKRDY